jgi:hypothetical protein
MKRLPAMGLLCLATHVAHSEWFDQGPVFTVTEENDCIVRNDRHYTQGFKLSYLHTDNHAPGWLKKCAESIPTLGFSAHAVKIGTEVGQSIYTPEDLEATEVVLDDRPYAGWLYTGFILQRRGLTAAKNPTLESFQLDIGVVGPESLAEQVQAWAHHKTEPQGWNNQLDTEVGVALKYMRAWIFSPKRDGPRTFDFIPHAGFSLGNIDTSFRVGGMIRAGINLPNDFGARAINSLATTEGGLSATHSGESFGCYFFGGVEGSVLAYNEFLDGTLFRESHSVTRELLVAEATGGFALVWPRMEFGFAVLWRSFEFTKQSYPDVYASLFVKVKL